MLLQTRVALTLILSTFSVNCLIKRAATKIDANDIKLVQNASKWFPKVVHGYEEVIRKFNSSLDATLFTSVHMPDAVIRHNGTDDDGQDLVILAGDPETKVPYKNVTTLVVLRSVASSISRYTSHLAYVRKFRGEVSVEWDIYSIHYHAINGSFATAFLPGRDGPDTITIGLGLTMTRSKRREVTVSNAPTQEQEYQPDYRDYDDDGKKQAEASNKAKGRSLLSLLRKSVSPPRVQPPVQKHLQWTKKTTEPTVIKSSSTLSDLKAEEEITTEYPMYGDSLSVDEYGFKVPPPWSEFRLHDTTTEPSVEETSHIVPKTLCFGLRSNCSERPITPPPRLKKTCMFGLRCKESFVDRYAVKTTSTVSPTEDEHTPKNKYESLEECEAMEISPSFGRTMSGPLNKLFTNLLAKKPSGRNKHSKPRRRSKSKAATQKKSQSNKTTIADLRQTEITEQLKKSHKTAAVKNSTDLPPQTTGNKAAKKQPIISAEEGETGSRRRRSIDPCAKYRVAAPMGESLMQIEDGSNKAAKEPVAKAGNKMEDTAGNESVVTLPPEVKEAINPFTNSLNAFASSLQSGIPPWLENTAIDVINKLLLSVDEGPEGEKLTVDAINKDDNENKSKPLEESSDADSAPKRKRLSTKDTKASPDNKMEAELDVSNEADEDRLDLPRLKKEDSAPKDLLKLDIPYIGVGNCAFVEFKKKSFPSELKNLLDVYLQALKVQCLPNIKNQTMKLFDNELVKQNGTQVVLNLEHKFFRKKTLGENEWMNLASTVLLTDFSTVYKEQYEKFMSNKRDNKSPDKKKLSGTVKTLTLLVLKILDSLHAKQKAHAIKFGNILLVIVQAQRSELVTQNAELEQCEKCTEEKNVNFNDQIQLYSLMRFIVDKLPEIVVTSSSLQTMFNKFYTDNLRQIRELVTNKIPFVY